ncbi:MAG TPA: hypothetical protein VN031_02015 [Candidatus Microsaccharimonas sp.]|nr:hypothetical protein [Candidatus Microsaccharimonas sp.]
MSHNNHQSGFAAIEAVLILVIVAMLAGTGYYVWHARQATNRSLEQAAKSTQQKVTASVKPDTTAQKIKDSKEASGFVTKTYVTYATSLNTTHNASTALNVVKNDLSDQLFVTLLGKSGSSDPLLCDQTVANPTTIAVISVIPSATVIGTSIELSGDYAGRDAPTIQANYNISTHKITDIICP